MFFIDNVPDEGGRNLKRRRLIVIHSPEQIASASVISFCGASGSAFKEGRIQIPCRDDDPRCKTGFPSRTWAVPPWLLQVPTDLVPETKEGRIRPVLVQEIVDSVRDAVRAKVAKIQVIKRADKP